MENNINKLEEGTIVEAGNLGDSSFFSKVRARVTGYKNGRCYVQVFEFISKWSDTWEKHPTSCGMSLFESQILEVNPTTMTQPSN